jgi:hypothetical protein
MRRDLNPSIRQSVNQSGNPINHSVDPAHNQIRSDQIRRILEAEQAGQSVFRLLRASRPVLIEVAPHRDAMRCTAPAAANDFYSLLPCGWAWSGLATASPSFSCSTHFSSSCWFVPPLVGSSALASAALIRSAQDPDLARFNLIWEISVVASSPVEPLLFVDDVRKWNRVNFTTFVWRWLVLDLLDSTRAAAGGKES